MSTFSRCPHFWDLLLCHVETFLFLQLLSLREQLGDTGHSLADKITTSPLSLSTYTHPSSYPTTLGAYPSLSSTLPPYTTSSHKYPPSLSSLPHSTPPSLEPFKLTFSLPSSSSSATSSSLAVSVPGSDGAAVPSGPSAHPATTTDEYTGIHTLLPVQRL